MNQQQQKVQQQISKAKSLQGWLEKKGGLKWQKRYFMIVEVSDKHFELSYFEKDTDQKPKGSINIQDITDIIADGDKEFVLNYVTKNFKLRANNTSIRNEWMTSLIHLKNYANGSGDRKKSLQEAPQQRNSLKISPRNHRLSEPGKPNHKSIDPDVLKQICESREERVGSGHSLSSSPTKIHKTADEIFEILGLQQYIDSIKPKEIIQNRMIYGYMKKLSKSSNKTGYLRFFLLISSKPLYPSKGYTDERILTNSDLPPWMDIDKLYFFDSNKISESKRPSKEFHMQDVMEVKCFDSIQAQQEKGFVFIVSEQSRLYQFSTNSETDRQKWVGALDIAMSTAKEIKKGGGQIKKNIDTITKNYDQSDPTKKKQNLRKKIDTDCMHIVLNYYGSEQKNDNIFTLISYLGDVIEDMKNTLEACLYKEPVRQDIMKEYSEYLHEKICEEIKQFWDQHHEKINNEGVLSLAKFFYDYNEKVKKYFKDQRLEEATNTLLNIYASKSMTISEETIVNIIEKEKKNTEPQISDESYLYSNTPVDLFKLINTAIDSGYRLCPIKGFLKSIGKFAQYTISFYQDQSQEVLEDDLFNKKQLIVFCNNTVKFEEKVKEFQKRLKTLGGFTDEEVDEMLKSHEIVKQFIMISNNAYASIASIHLCQLRTLFQKKSFLELDVAQLFNTIFDHASETTEQFFMSYQKKLWKDILEYLVLFYFQTMISSCKKAKKEHLQQYISKIEQDEVYLQQQFKEVIFKKTLETSLLPFQHMKNLLTTEDGSNIQKDIKKLRITFGIAFTHKTVAYIYQIRKDMSKDDIEYVVNTSENTIKQYNKEHEDEEINTRIDIGKPIEVLGIDIDADHQEILQDEEVQSGRNKKKTIFISLNTEDSLNTSISDISLKDNKSLITNTGSEEKVIETIEEGYLYKRKPDKYVYDRRFFRLRDNGLYWYLTETSQDVQNKIDISSIEEVLPEAEAQNLFEIILQGTKGKKGKIYKFKAENKQERDLWISSIKFHMHSFDEKSGKDTVPIEAISVEGKLQRVITDYEEIKRKQRAILQAQERQRRQQEKEERARQMALMVQQDQQQDQKLAPSVSIHEIRSSSQKNVSIFTPTAANQFVVYKNENSEPFLHKKNKTCFDKISDFCRDLGRKFK